jgi:uncharacterized phage protein gp47/JayE
VAFQIKSFTSIAAALINHMRGTQPLLTDFNVGAVARTLVEAPAVEMDELYQQLFNGLKEAIPVATYLSFNFSNLPAMPGSGLMSVVIAQQPTDTIISAGTVFSSPDARVTYSSSTDVTITAGDTTASVLAVAATAGVIGNLDAGASFTMTPTSSGFVSATNVAAFINGAEAETADQKKQRFALFIDALQRGTVAALEYGAKTVALYDANGMQIERVQAAKVIEPYLLDDTQPIGLVNLYVHNGVGSTSGDLVTQTVTVMFGYVDGTGKKIPGWKAAGIHLVVAAATEVPLAVTAAVTVVDGYIAADVLGAVSGAIANYILALDIGESFLFSEAVALAMAVAGVENIVFTTPTADHAATDSEKLMPGTFAITQA